MLDPGRFFQVNYNIKILTCERKPVITVIMTASDAVIQQFCLIIIYCQGIRTKQLKFLSHCKMLITTQVKQSVHCGPVGFGGSTPFLDLADTCTDTKIYKRI